jgi:hypothetical protein
VQSSALADGMLRLHWCSARTAGAQLSIGFTGHHHRQFGAIRSLGRRQDSVLPVILGLHQSSSAEAELHVQNVSLILTAGVTPSFLFPVMRRRAEAGDP